MSEKIRNRIQFIEELKTLKEKADAEGIIFLITDAVSRSICDMDEVAKVLGMETKRGRRGAKIWKIADFVRANIANINIEAIVIDEEELNFPVSEVFVNETIVPSDNLESRIIKGDGADYDDNGDNDDPTITIYPRSQPPPTPTPLLTHPLPPTPTPLPAHPRPPTPTLLPSPLTTHNNLKPKPPPQQLQHQRFDPNRSTTHNSPLTTNPTHAIYPTA